MNILTDVEIPKIIQVILFFGDNLMDWFEDLTQMVEMIGAWGVVVVLWAVMPILILVVMTTIFTSIQKQSRQNNNALTGQIERLTEAITILTAMVQLPPMNVEDSIDYYYLVMNSHVLRKLRYLGGTLRKNSIESRKAQIKKNIEKEFKAITISECSKLSKKHSECGDMGKAVHENIDWGKFLKDVCDIFFVKTSNREEEHLKIKDIETLICSEVDRIAEIIKDNGVHN